MPTPPPVYPPVPPTGLGYGGAGYAYTFYGSGAFPRQPIAVTGGYGGQQYGYNSYGSLDTTPPRVSGAVSLDGFRIEVFFSEEMRDNAAFRDPLNYVITPVLGAPTATVSITPGTPGDLGGYTSVIVTHEGTTLGGKYVITVSNLEDMAGNPFPPPPANQTTLLTLGDQPTYVVTAPAGDHIQFRFLNSLGNPQDMLTEAEFTPGVQDLSSYSVTTTYPVPITLVGATHPVGGDASKVSVQVSAMTSAAYATQVSPATAIVYDGSYLPSASTEFTGVEIGTGSSTASTPTKLLLSKEAGDFYGWSFEDITGKILPSSTFRFDFAFDASVATYLPGLYDTVLGVFSFSDGVVQVNVFLTRIGGMDILTVSSGAFTQQVPSTWSTTPTTLTLIRNQKANSYALLVNGSPTIAAPAAAFTGIPTINPGAQFIFAATYKVTHFKIASLSATSSQTVFTTAWNFLHSIGGSFTGSSLLANDRILTKRGPLVKGWGDGTPATKQDVEVRVNGVPVAVKGINPYTGTIFPAIPIPRTTPGTVQVEVDYIWFPAPAFQLATLNTPGLVLNKWDRPRGHTAGAVSPAPPGHLGTMGSSRFPMGIVLTPMTRPNPIEIGHRYIGFERLYSALLNSPTTLRLNQNPHRVSVPGLTSSCQVGSGSFDGTTTPPLAGTPWSLDGTDTGYLVGDGTYLVVDASAGDFATGTAAIYYREEDFTCGSTVRLAARLRVSEYVPDGVFTGVAFGFHDNFRLYVVGLLEVNGLHHVGLLTDASQPQDQDSWQIGPSALATITSTTTFTIPAGLLPSNVEPGSWFQILDGPQAGVYQVAICGIDQYQGLVTITLDPTTPFPGDPSGYGNNTATVIFEVPWDEVATTFRLVATTSEDDTERTAQLFLGGVASAAAVELQGTAISAIPAETSLLIPTGDEGRVFWGSLSRPATNTTTWSLYRYGLVPDSLTSTVRGIVVAAEMSTLPEDDPNHEWWITNGFGYSEIDASGDTMLLKSTSESPTGVLDLTFGYSRLEPVLTTHVFADVDAKFKVESGVLGAGDACVRVRDDIREVCLTTILYRDGLSSRYLIRMPAVSLSGLMTPAESGWTTATGNTLAAPTAHNQQFTITKTLGKEGFWVSSLASSANTSDGRIIEARLAVTSFTPGVGGLVGPTWGAYVGAGPVGRDVRVTLKASPSRVVLTDAGGAEKGAFPFDWTDGAPHTYRVITDPVAATVVLVVDDVVQGTVALGLFGNVPTIDLVRVGAQGTTGASVAVWDSFHVHALPIATAKRTLGVWLGGDVNDIDNFALPRLDSLDVPNSSLSASIKEMDWQNYVKVRVHLDQTWGVSIYRPDLPPPPWFTGDFATQITDPTAAWINVEYRDLPTYSGDIGRVSFGALDPRSVTQQRWKEVRYRLYNTPDEDYIQPSGMVLNRYNVITSGEWNRDTTPEVVTIISLTATMVSIRSAHMNADRVFNVIVDGTVLSSSAWTFDPESQTIILASPLPSAEYPVTVTFAPGKPITNTYLCSQPFGASVTKLNEGTPPVPMSQTADATQQVLFGSRINDPNDTLGSPDFILNDPYRSVEWSDPANGLYDSLTFCETDNGGQEGLLSIACDGPAPEAGLVALELRGPAYHDVMTVPGGPAGPWGKASPVIGGTAARFNQTTHGCLHVSGGKYVDGVLGPGTAILYPNFPGEGMQGVKNSPAAQQGMGLNQEIKWRLTTVTPYAEVWDLPSTATDNVPPSAADPVTDPNPDGTPGLMGHGACAAKMVNYLGPAGRDRLGPWGGMGSLAYSLLGGGAPLTGVELTLNGGAPVPGPVTTTFQIEAAN